MKVKNCKARKPICLLFKKDGEKYGGMYVAQKKFGGKKVIAADKSPYKLYKKVEKMGVKKPVIFWVPPKGATLIYNVAT